MGIIDEPCGASRTESIAFFLSKKTPFSVIFIFFIPIDNYY